MNKNGSLYISLVALLVSISAVVISLNGGKETQSGMSVEETLKNNPKLVVEAMQNYEKIAREEALASAQKMLEDNIDAINNDPNTPVIGNPNGEIVLVEFFDFSCGYCHRLYPALKNIIAKNPNVKVLAKSLAFVSPVSGYVDKIWHKIFHRAVSVQLQQFFIYLQKVIQRPRIRRLVRLSASRR